MSLNQFNSHSQPSLYSFSSQLSPSNKYQPRTSNPEIQHELYMLESHYSVQIQRTKFQMQKVIAENHKLRQDLQSEKQKSFQLQQIKRRLQEQIRKMEFEWQKIASHQILHTKQTTIKSQQLLFQNQRVQKQIDSLTKQLSETKEKYRNLMTEYGSFRKNYDTLLMRQRSQWIKIHGPTNHNNSSNMLTYETASYDNELQLRSNIKKENNNSMKTMPSSNMVSISINSPKSNNPNLQATQERSPQKQQFKEHKKESLHCQFYSQKGNKLSQQYPLKKQCEPSKIQQQSPDILMLRTFQKSQLTSQLTSLRSEIISELMSKYYQKSVQLARKKHTNCLKQFIALLNKNFNTLGRMSQNYLQARQTVQKQCGKQFLQVKNTEDWVQKIYQKTKQQSKAQWKVESFCLSIFRLLTIYSKMPASHPLLPQIEHSAIKSLYKLYGKMNKE